MENCYFCKIASKLGPNALCPVCNNLPKGSQETNPLIIQDQEEEEVGKQLSVAEEHEEDEEEVQDEEVE